jgi:hypothetical protein
VGVAVVAVMRCIARATADLAQMMTNLKDVKTKWGNATVSVLVMVV